MPAVTARRRCNAPPPSPKIYHIVHVDRLPSIVADDGLLCDAMMSEQTGSGTTIGMNQIKQRRLKVLRLNSHPDLFVGDCVPFYFCPRSVMLYVLHRANHPALSYRGGQGPILHLEADVRRTVAWAEDESLRWAFTRSNAGACYLEDWNDLERLDEIDWNAVRAKDWRLCQDEKQAEFLVEKRFAWKLVSRIGVLSQDVRRKVREALEATDSAARRPRVEIRRNWYY